MLYIIDAFFFIITNNQYDQQGNKINNKFVNNIGSEITLYFSYPLRLGNNPKGYEICVRRSSIVYCTPNISAALKNNKLTYSFKDVTNTVVQQTITFDDGLYSLNDINLKISLFTSQINNSQDSQLIYFSPDESTSRIYVIFSKANVVVDASATNSILLTLGFTITQGTYNDGLIGNFSDPSLYDISDNKAQLNPIQNYLISTNISTGNYFDSDVSNVIENIPIGQTTSGSLTEFDSNNPTKSDVNVRNIDKLTISLLDNYGNLVDMATANGTKPPEAFSIEISITEKTTDL